MFKFGAVCPEKMGAIQWAKSAAKVKTSSSHGVTLTGCNPVPQGKARSPSQFGVAADGGVDEAREMEHALSRLHVSI